MSKPGFVARCQVMDQGQRFVRVVLDSVYSLLDDQIFCVDSNDLLNIGVREDWCIDRLVGLVVHEFSLDLCAVLVAKLSSAD